MDIIESNTTSKNWFKVKKITILIKGENKMSKEFKVDKDINFKDEETKRAYLKFLNEINEYNKKRANGEITEQDFSCFLNKFKEKFKLEEETEGDFKTADSETIKKLLNNAGLENKETENTELDNLIQQMDKEIAKLENNKYENFDIDSIIKRVNDEINIIEKKDN